MKKLLFIIFMFPLISKANESLTPLECPYLENLWKPVSDSCVENFRELKGNDWNVMDLDKCATPLYNKEICNNPQYRDRLVIAAKRTKYQIEKKCSKEASVATNDFSAKKIYKNCYAYGPHQVQLKRTEGFI